jgi:group I intron endonuclease
MFKNLINGKRYIGSSENLNRRFLQYFNINYLIRDNCMQICRAILIYGYSNFSIEILEYCEPAKCLKREKYYFLLLNPEYNTSKEPGAPMSGRTHSDEKKILMSEAKKGEKNPMYNKRKPEGAGKGRPSQVIEVTDIKNTSVSFALHKSYISRALRSFLTD